MGQALLSQERARKGVQMAQWHQSTAAEGQGPWSVQSWWQRGLATASSGDRASLLWHCQATLVLGCLPCSRDPSAVTRQEMGQDKGLVYSVVPTQVGSKA